MGFGQNPREAILSKGSHVIEGNGSTQKGSEYHGNHSPLEKAFETSWGTDSSTKQCFSGSHFGAPKGSWAFLGQVDGSAFRKWGRVANMSKLPVAKLCRIHWSLPQTEPYVARYGLEPFCGWGPKLWGVASPFPMGRLFCPRGDTKPQRRPQSPGAAPKPLRPQPQSLGANPSSSGYSQSPCSNTMEPRDNGSNGDSRTRDQGLRLGNRQGT